MSLDFGLLARLYFHSLHYEKFPDGTVKCIEDEIPFELPEGWEWCRLSTISQYISDGDHQPPPQTDDGIPFLVISNVSNGFLDFTSTRYVSPDYYNGIAEYRKPCKGDLLFTVTGSYGIPVLVNENKPFCFQRHIAIIRPIIISNSFLSYELGTSYIKTICDNQSTGTAQKTVGLATLRSFILPIPPITEQQRIESKIKELLLLTDNIESDKTDLQTTIQLTKSKILDLAIKGKLVPQNPDDEPASVLLDRIRAEKEELIKQGKIKRDKKESVIYKGDDNSYYEKIVDTVTCIDEELPFKLPNGWTWVRLSSACIINPKNSITDDTVVSFVPMTLIQDGYANECTFEQRKWGEVKKGFTHFAENDVGFAKITPCFENRKSVVFRGLCNGYGAGTTELYILRTFPDTIMPEYILYIVKTESFLVGGKQTCAGVVGQQRISKDYVCDYLVPVPPLNEQVRIIKKCAEIMTMLHNIEKSLS